MDWYDKYPCYQNANADPAGVDRERGRIWRVVYTGERKGAPVPSRPSATMNLAAMDSLELVKLLEDSNVWQRRIAQRLLSERRDLPGAKTLHEKSPVHALMKNGPTLESRLAALWTLHSADMLEDEVLDGPAEDKEPAMRAWAARITGERGYPFGDAIKRLGKLGSDPDPTVRLAVATAARQFVSGSLTVDTLSRVPVREVITGPILSSLWFSSFDAKDPLIPFMYWMALEPIVAYDPVHTIEAYQHDGALGAMPLSGILLTKIMRRVCDMRDPARLDQCVQLLANLTDKESPAVLALLNGLIEGQRGNAMVPAKSTVDTVARFAKFANPEVASRALQLGALWGDTAALQQVLVAIGNTSAPESARVDAIRIARQLKNDAARDEILQVATGKNSDAITIAAIGALSEMGGRNVAEPLIASWRNSSPAVRRAAAETMISRPEWRAALLKALEDQSISASDLSAAAIRSLVNSRDAATRERAAKAIGRYRETEADKLKLIAAKRAVVLAGEPDRQAGREIARKSCLVCHKFYGEGGEVGPDLTGVGRSSLDSLLHNVIVPNEVIGKGYENVEVETRDGRTVSGRLVENTDTRVRLLASGPKEEIVSRSDIGSMRVSELSVMPEGLEQMPDADFRNLIWYILNPPQDNKPLTPEYRRQLTGEQGPSASVDAPVDEESVALWNPEWRVSSAKDGGAPAKLVEYAGRRNVLRTRPFSVEKGAVLERLLKLPDDKPAHLSFAVAASARENWELRIFANGRLLKSTRIGHDGVSWEAVDLDLSSFAGAELILRLENAAQDGALNAGYWSDLKIIAEGREPPNRRVARSTVTDSR
jgi:putative heme-binding domain-containing protein